LHKADDGSWIAYSRWPNKNIRDASWGDDTKANGIAIEMECSIQELKACIDPNKPFQEICMTVVNDLWVDGLNDKIKQPL